MKTALLCLLGLALVATLVSARRGGGRRGPPPEITDCPEDTDGDGPIVGCKRTRTNRDGTTTEYCDPRCLIENYPCSDNADASWCDRYIADCPEDTDGDGPIVGCKRTRTNRDGTTTEYCDPRCLFENYPCSDNADASWCDRYIADCPEDTDGDGPVVGCKRTRTRDGTTTDSCDVRCLFEEYPCSDNADASWCGEEPTVPFVRPYSDCPSGAGAGEDCRTDVEGESVCDLSCLYENYPCSEDCPGECPYANSSWCWDPSVSGSGRGSDGRGGGRGRGGSWGRGGSGGRRGRKRSLVK